MHTVKLTALFLFSIICTACSSNIETVMITGFENDNYSDWKTSGNAFGQHPAEGTLPGQQPVNGFEGGHLINSFLNGDKSTGTLTSPEFTIHKMFINFLIGGGYHPEKTVMNLYIDGQIVKSSTGHDTEQLLWDCWDISDYVGKKAHLEIVDEHAGGWGHILVDHIEQSDKPKVNYANTPIARAMGSMLLNVEKSVLDPTRPVYHFASPSQWMNDINGPIYYKGYYHIFYQHNPYGDQWGRMHWGHARSRDMVNWEHLPIALWPSREKSEEHCFSGCLAVNKLGEPIIYYTSIGHQLPEQWAAKGSEDLLTWQKCDKNPILKMADHNGLFIEDWRDPFIFHASQKTYMVLGGKLREKDGGQAIATIYETIDDRFLRWEYKGVLFRHPNKDLQSLECPNFFPLNHQYVMLDSPYGPVEYFIGSFDDKKYIFAPRNRGLIDHSNDYYATNIIYDDTGRCILLGWIRGFRPGRGWNGCMSLPRIITIDTSGRLIQKPATESEELRGNCSTVNNLALDNTSCMLDITGDALEIKAVIQLDKTDQCGLRLCCDDNGKGGIEIKFEKEKVTVADIEIPVENKDKLGLHIFLDKSVLEVFIDNGHQCVSKVICPKIENKGVQIFAEGGKTTFESIEAWQLKPAKIEFSKNLLKK